MTALLQLALVRLPGTPAEWLAYGLTFVLIVVLLVFVFSAGLRKFLRRSDATAVKDEFAPPQPKSENQAAFMAASMQSVIARLKEQEKELERLHRLEKERAQQTAQLSVAVTRNMPTGLLLVNEAGLITMSNPAAEAVLGTSGLAFRRYSEVLGPGQQLVQLLSACLQEGRTFQREELLHTTPAGAARHLGVTISPALLPGEPRGKVAGALCLLTDLTELNELQAQVRLKENLAALGEMSAGIAHEFKNSLATISGYAQLIRNDASAGGEMAESAEKILAQIRGLTHVVTEFLRFARPFEFSATEVDLRAVTDGAVEECAARMPGVQFQVTGEFREVTGDEGLLRQALLNLMRNAVEAVTGASSQDPPASRQEVTITGAYDEYAGRPAQRISIADTGPGIPKADLPKLFLPFFTTKPEGTGLGLALVQKIVVNHGGAVQARNRPEGGAEFILWLPLAREPAQAVDSASTSI